MIILRKLAAGILVMALSSAIFFLLVSDKTTKRNFLRPTLETLGKQLFAAVREDSGRADLVKNYDDFIRKAEASEFDQQEVEEVAAQILNLTTRDSLISAEEALRIFTIAPQLDAIVESTGKQSELDRSFDEPPPPKTFKTRKPLNKQEFEEKLLAMMEFQQKLALASKDAKIDKSKRKKYYSFQADSGLKVSFDYDVLHLLEQQDRVLADQVRELEKKKWLQWQYELDQEKKRQIVMKDSLLRTVTIPVTVIEPPHP